MFPNIPKTVGIIVKSGDNLEYSVPGSKKSAKTWRWRVVFIGSKEKMATEFIEASNGCPVWDCEVTLDMVNPADPVVMLVLDGKKRHIGQVVVPLAQIPQTGPPNFDPSRLRYSDLEPTKKNSMPRGRLVYWIWAISYWPPGTTPSAGGKTKSLRDSISNLGSHMPKHRPSGLADDGQSSWGSLARPPSMVSGAAPSMVSGASFSESMLPPTSGGLPPGGAPRGPYNPLASNDDERMSVVSGGSQSCLPGRPPVYQHHFNQNQGSGGSSDDTASLQRRRKNRILAKMKDRLSRSSLHLNKAAALAGGDKVYSNGSMLSVRSGENKPRSSMTLQRNSQDPSDESPHFSAAGYVAGPKSAMGSQQQLQPGPLAPGQRANGPMGTGSSLIAPNSPVANHNEPWGLHPEERPHKPLEEMSLREVREHALQMEQKFHVSKTEVGRLQTENAELRKRAETAEEDLSDVRVTLANLRNQLLQDNLTEYLELHTDGSEGCLGFGSRSQTGTFRRSQSMGQLANSQAGGDAPAAPVKTSQAQSFFAKLSAISLTGARKQTGGEDSMSAMGGQAAGLSAGDRDSSMLGESTNGEMDWW